MTRLEVLIRKKEFPAVGRAPEHVALNDLSLEVADREFVCVVGPSGCGKTTLLNCIAGLDRSFEGQVHFRQVAGRDQPVIGYVFQTPRLLPWRTVMENIELVLPQGRVGTRSVQDLLAAAGLEKAANVYPQRLSLGMQRRAALVRAFVVEPDVMLMDEPFVSLDEPTAQRLRQLLVRVWTDRPATVVFVTHDLREAIQLADRIVLLSPAPGSVVADFPIDVPRSERNDELAVEGLRKRLIDRHPLLKSDL